MNTVRIVSAVNYFQIHYHFLCTKVTTEIVTSRNSNMFEGVHLLILSVCNPIQYLLLHLGSQIIITSEKHSCLPNYPSSNCFCYYIMDNSLTTPGERGRTNGTEIASSLKIREYYESK